MNKIWINISSLNIHHVQWLVAIVMLMSVAAFANTKAPAEIVFVQTVTDSGIALLSDRSVSFDKRKKEFRKFLQQNFDVDTIGRFTIGRHWKTMTEMQRTAYLKNFEDYLVNVYSRRFQEYEGQELKAVSSNPTGKNDFTVTSYLVPTSGNKIQIDWRVRQKEPSYKIIDVVVAGVSMAITHRSDFSSVIQRNGGNVDILIEYLAQQNKAVLAKGEAK